MASVEGAIGKSRLRGIAPLYVVPGGGKKGLKCKFSHLLLFTYCHSREGGNPVVTRDSGISLRFSRNDK
jgi:hypothetical protein